MIKQDGKVFIIETDELSYIFHINNSGLLIHDYFGNKIKLDNFDVTNIEKKLTIQKGTSTIYDGKDPNFSMDLALLEFSFPNKGDYKTTPLLLRGESHGYIFDFSFHSFSVNKEIKELEGLPTPHDGDEELIIILKEKSLDLFLELHYLVFSSSNVIARNVVLINNSQENIVIEKLLSYQLDLINRNFELINFTGGWASEMNKQIQELKVGKYVHESLTGNSSAKNNPLFVVREKGSSLDAGDTYIFNLVYSGNHIIEVELATYGNVRIQAGINPFCFNVPITNGNKFITPYAVMTYSNKGINGARTNMHHFVNNHIIPSNWNQKDRPIAINNWEATTFKFNERKLLKIAKNGKKVGAELFVLDDGWFSTRNDDMHGLGDYNVNKKKLPHGLNGLSKKIHKMGMLFGLWFEPEAVNPNSDLYKKHPDWIIRSQYLEPSLSRNEYLLDLTKNEVREYIIESVSKTIKNNNVDYVKWDMNRNMSDVYQNNYYHYYILGLYEIMDCLIKMFPDVLFEGCASGGNRFDLGILSYFPQIWASDDTDAIERLSIQSGYYIGYPQSTVSCHLSSLVSQHTLRKEEIDTKINVAMFGIFGLELFLNDLKKNDLKEVKKSINLYKQNRALFQYGILKEFDDYNANFVTWSISSIDKESAVLGHFNLLQKMNCTDQYLEFHNLDDNVKYRVIGQQKIHNVLKFGSLINTITPFHINPDSSLAKFLSHFVKIKGDYIDIVAFGNQLNNKAIPLYPEWSGTGINEKVRLLGDFGSRIYLAQKILIDENKS